MIQIQGLYPAKTGLIYDSPMLRITFHGTPLGNLTIDIEVLNGNGANTGYLNLNIKKEDLVYKTEITDPYDSLLNAIQENIILQLQSENTHNATFSII